MDMLNRVEKIRKAMSIVAILLLIGLCLIVYNSMSYSSKETKSDIEEKKTKSPVKDAKNKEMTVGETSKADTNTKKDDQRSIVNYQSSNEEVLKVLSDGTMTAVGEGSSTVTTSYSNGESTSITVNVTQENTKEEASKQPSQSQKESDMITEVVVEEVATSGVSHYIIEKEEDYNKTEEKENYQEKEEKNKEETIDEKTKPTENSNQKVDKKQEEKEEEKIITGWQKKTINKKEVWYYYDSKGVIQTGWQYLSKDGKKAWYYFNSNGIMATSTTVDGYTIDENGARVETITKMFQDFAHLKRYNQDGQYKNRSVCASGGRSVGATACGLSTYMATRYVLTGKDTNFMAFANEACRTGLYNGAGTTWQVLERKNSSYTSKYGIKGYSIGRSYDSIVKELKKGNVVVVMIQNGSRNVEAGGFNATSNGHFIALVSYDSNKEKIYVYNPNSNNMGWHTKDEINKFVVKPAKLLRSMYATK